MEALAIAFIVGVDIWSLPSFWLTTGAVDRLNTASLQPSHKGLTRCQHSRRGTHCIDNSCLFRKERTFSYYDGCAWFDQFILILIWFSIPSLTV